MKLLLIASLLFLAKAHGANALLTCLGDEEKRLHLAKDTGPLYELNQKMIAEMIQIPNVTISNADFRSVCQSRRISVSWKLLELSLKKGDALFVIPKGVTGLQKNITEGMIDDYVEASKEILLAFISQVQTLSPTPDCLVSEVPKLEKLFTRIKYLQEDVDIKKIMEPLEENIFDRVTDYPKYFQRCRERTKKKASPGSTAPAKKP